MIVIITFFAFIDEDEINNDRTLFSNMTLPLKATFVINSEELLFSPYIPIQDNETDLNVLDENTVFGQCNNYQRLQFYMEAKKKAIRKCSHNRHEVFSMYNFEQERVELLLPLEFPKATVCLILYMSVKKDQYFSNISKPDHKIYFRSLLLNSVHNTWIEKSFIEKSSSKRTEIHENPIQKDKRKEDRRKPFEFPKISDSKERAKFPFIMIGNVPIGKPNHYPKSHLYKILNEKLTGEVFSKIKHVFYQKSSSILVYFADIECIKIALQALNGYNYEGKVLTVSFEEKLPRLSKADQKKYPGIVIKNAPTQSTKTHLRTLIEKYLSKELSSKIKDAHASKDGKLYFIHFEDQNSATAAHSKLNGLQYQNDKLNVEDNVTTNVENNDDEDDEAEEENTKEEVDPENEKEQVSLL